MKTKFFLTLGVSILLASSAFAQKPHSAYTSLDDKKCRTIESNTGEGWYRGLCAGVGGYRLELTEGDLRQSITVISPAKKKYELGFTRITGAFSSVGAKAEWRVKGKTPIALIVRFDASENPEDATKTTSYLIVSKITKTQACVTDVVKPMANQNAEAQKLADVSQTKPCRIFQ